MKLLIIEDDLQFLRPLTRDLKELGFKVETATDGLEGLQLAKQLSVDLIILDGMLPRIDGWNLVERLRSENSTPVLMLTARDSLRDRINGLDAGADDYLTKPFHFDELVARIKALIRRNTGTLQPQLKQGNLLVNPESKTITLAGEPVRFTAREYLILERLMTRRGKILSNESLASYLSSNGEDVTFNTIEVHLSRIRKKIGKGIIRTIRGMGYTIDPS